MKKVLSLYIPALLFTVILISCEYLEDFEKGNGNIVSEKREVDAFERIKIGGNFDVLLVKATNPGLRIITDENLHPFIKSEVYSGALEIQQERNLISKQKIRIIIQYDQLSSIRVTGAARLQNEEYIEEETLELRMEGAGMIDLGLQAERLRVSLSGAGLVKLHGQVDRQDVDLSGAGKLSAFDLESRIAEVTVGGIGGAEIFVTEELDATIDGVGGIEYEGNPADIRTVINGIGKIRPVNDQQ